MNVSNDPAGVAAMAASTFLIHLIVSARSNFFVAPTLMAYRSMVAAIRASGSPPGLSCRYSQASRT